MKPMVAALWILFVTVPAFTQAELPPAPEGFQWKTVSDVKVSYLHPKDWYFLYETQGNTVAFFSTKEEITPTQNFQTGLSVNVIRNIRQDTDAYMEQFFQTYQSQNTLFAVERTTFGPFKAIQFTTTKTFDDGSEITIFNYVVSNKAKGTLFFIIFESPASQWSAEWEKGQVILSSLGLDEGV